MEAKRVSRKEQNRRLFHIRRQQKPIIEGFLQKRAVKSGRNWKKRYFRLFPDRLEYYMASHSKFRKGTMGFSTEFFVADSNFQQHGFIVSDFKTTYYLAAETDEEKSFWMHTIARVIRKLQQDVNYFGAVPPNFIGQEDTRTEQEKEEAYRARLAAYEKARQTQTRLIEKEAGTRDEDKKTRWVRRAPTTEMARSNVPTENIEPTSNTKLKGSKPSKRVSRMFGFGGGETKSVPKRGKVEENANLASSDTVAKQEDPPSNPGMGRMPSVRDSISKFEGNAKSAKDLPSPKPGPRANPAPKKSVMHSIVGGKAQLGEDTTSSPPSAVIQEETKVEYGSKKKSTARKPSTKDTDEQSDSRPKKSAHNPPVAIPEQKSEKLRNRIANWNVKADKHKEAQESNPFVNGMKKKDFKKGDENYGMAPPGSKSESRAQAAAAWVDKEIDKLLSVIHDLGSKNDQGLVTIEFGPLFVAYQDISDTLVGILMRAKKRKLLWYEGDMLFQGYHDNVKISILK